MPEIDRSVYLMPMFVTHTVRDLAAAEGLYAAAGFAALATVPGPDGAPAVVHLRRQRHQDVLLASGEPVTGTTSASFAAGDVDLAAVAEQLRQAGAEVTGPVDTPWFSTDLTFTDRDGNTTTLTAPRQADADAAQEWAAQQIVGVFDRPTRSRDLSQGHADA